MASPNFNITANQIADYFRYFADGHIGIQRFHAGNTLDKSVFSKTDKSFPFMYVEFVDSTPRQNTKEFTFNVFVLDRKQKASTNKSESNEFEVLSDTDLILDHLVRYIKNDTINKVKMVSDFTHLPLSNSLSDFCTGCYVNLIVKVPFNSYDTCDIPWSGTTTGGTTVTYLNL